MRAAATAGSGTGLAVTGAVTIHSGTVGKYTSGVAVTAGGTGTDIAVDATHNELTVQIGNTVRTITFAAGADDNGTAANIQTAMRTAFAAGPADRLRRNDGRW